MTTPRPLATKLARIMGELRHVPKNGYNSFHKYAYTMESDIVDALRGHLAAAGVIIMPSVVGHTVAEADRKQTIATVTLELTIIDGESGDSLVSQWVGQGMDQGDKAYYKAYTGAMKYALLKTFLISTGDDPEQDEPVKPAPQQQREDRRQRQQTAPAAAPRQDAPELTESFKRLSATWHAIVAEAMDGDKEAIDDVREGVKARASVGSWRQMPESNIQAMIDQWGAMPVTGRREYLTDRYPGSE